MARSVGLVDGDGDPDFTIIALGSRMQWENRVTADVGRNRLFRRGLRLQQLPGVVERSLHDLVDDVVGQILVCDREIVEPDRRVVALLSRIGSGRDQRLRNLRQFLADCGDLVGRRPYEIHRMRCNQRGEHWNREAGRENSAIQIARLQLRCHALHSAKSDGGLDTESVEYLRHIGAPRSRARAGPNAQPGEVIEPVKSKPFRRDELKGGVVHREYHPHRAIASPLGPIIPIPSLQSDAGGHKAERHLFLFQQHNILCRALRRQRRDLLSQVAGQDASQALTVSQIRSPRRRRADDDRLGRTGVVAGRHADKKNRGKNRTCGTEHRGHFLATFRRPPIELIGEADVISQSVVMLVFDKTSSIAHNCAWRNSDAGLTIVANGSWVQREHCIAIYIDRNCLFRRRLGFHQFLAIGEDLFYDLVNEVVRQVLVRDREVVEPDRVIVSGQRTICSDRNQGRRDFGHLVSHRGTLFRRRLYEIDWLPGIELRKRGDRESASNDHSVEFAVGHLRGYLFDSSKANVGGDAKDFENLRDIGAPGACPWTNSDSQSGEIVERLDRKALQRRELKGAVVHREYDTHRAIPGSLRPPGTVPALQGHARGDEAEHGFFLFHENNVLARPLSHLGGYLDLQRAGQYPRQTLAIGAVGPTRRGGPNADGTRPVPPLGPSGPAPSQGRSQDRCNQAQETDRALRGSAPIGECGISRFHRKSYGVCCWPTRYQFFRSSRMLQSVPSSAGGGIATP